MDAAVIKFKASGQQLSVVSTNLFAANTVNYIRAEFEFGDGWDGFDVVRAVWATDFAKIATILDTDGVTMVPWEVLKRPATLYVNLVGSISDGDELTDRLTTYKAKALDVNGCTNVDGDNTQPITPSQFEQFVAVVHDDAEAAADARDEARGYASDAEGYRDEAVGAAADAKDYRDAAKGYADDAEGYKDQAKGYADDAEADAEEIRNMSATATTLPEGSSATASYSDGVLSLGIPKGDTGATGATGNGIASAVLNADYTLTLNFTDGTHYTTPPIRGAQGVQGETGNGIDRIELTDTTGAVKTYTIYFTDGSTYDFEVTDGEVTLAELASVLPTDTASGSIASFPDGSDLFDYLSCVVNIEPVQAGSGTPSPQNLCPITGWTRCEVSQAGVNLWDIGNVSGTRTTSVNAEFKAGTYTISALGTAPTSTDTSMRIIATYKDGTSKTMLLTKGTLTSATFTTTSPIVSFSFWAASAASLSTGVAFEFSDIQLELGSTATDYTPYNGTTYPVSWQTEAGTVYGGKLHIAIVDGELKTWIVVDRAENVYDGSNDEVWSTGGNGRLYIQLNAMERMTDYIGSIYCDKLPTVKDHNVLPSQKGISGYVKDSSYPNQNWLYVAIDGVTTVAELRTWLNANPIQVVYPLATPTTYQLDPVQVACLLGQNNVWADCGDIEEVKYKADVQLWVEKMLNA